MHTRMKHAWLGLVALWLVLGGTPARAGEAVNGFGATPESAERMAMRNGAAKAEELVSEQLGPDAPGRLEVGFLEKEKVLRLLGKATPARDGGFEARCEVDLGGEKGDFLDQLRKNARQMRISYRQGLSARGLAEFVVALLVVVGYFRLEQLTAGYYTTLLRAGAVGVVVLTGLALWLTI
jgi:hypothetical protein